MIKNIINIEDSELIWLDQHHEITLDELTELSGLSLQDLKILVESGALTPINKASDTLQFSSHCIVPIRTLLRLKHDFELDQNALSLMLVFLERIQKLEFKLRELDDA